VCAWSDKAGKDFPSLCCSFLNSCFLHRCLTGYLSLTVKMSHIFSCNFICLSSALHSQVYSGNIFDKLFVFIFVQALLSVLCPEQHNALNAFQWTLQRTVMTFVDQVSFKVREHLCSLASLKDLVAVVRQHWQQLLELKVVFHSLKLLCFQCSVQSSTMLSMHFNGHFREHWRV
jgi:hypothetical protein